MSLIWISSILLFLLLFLNTLAIERKQVVTSLVKRWPESALTMGLIFVFFPLVVAAASRLFLKDQDFAFGMVISALAPCALVNPFFSQLRGGDPALSLVNVILSTLICPLVTVPMLWILGHQSVYLDSKYTMVYLFSLTFFPVAASLAWGNFWPNTRVRLSAHLPLLNSVILAVLMFILVGSSLARVPLRLIAESDLPILVLFSLISDFGFYFLVRSAGGLFFGKESAETLALSVSSRNFAVTASLMLFFHPKAALPAAIGLAVHALFFQFLTWKNQKAIAVLILTMFGGLGVSPHAQAARPPYTVKLTLCLPAYAEVPGTTALLAARDLGFFERAGLVVNFVILEQGIAKAVSEKKCHAGIISTAEVESTPGNLLSKLKPHFYQVDAGGGPPRLFVLAGGIYREPKDLSNKTVRVSSQIEATWRSEQFKKIGIKLPKFVIEPDPTRALTALKEKKLDALFLGEPFAAAALAEGDFWWLKMAPRESKVPSAFVFTGSSETMKRNMNPFLGAIRGGFDYLDLNPAESLRLVKDNSRKLKLSQPVPSPPNIKFGSRYFSQPQLRSVWPTETTKKDLALLEAKSSKTAKWLKGSL